MTKLQALKGERRGKIVGVEGPVRLLNRSNDVS